MKPCAAHRAAHDAGVVVAEYVTTVFASTLSGLSIAQGTASVQPEGSFSLPRGGRAVVGPVQSTPTLPQAVGESSVNTHYEKLKLWNKYLGMVCNMWLLFLVG